MCIKKTARQLNASYTESSLITHWEIIFQIFLFQTFSYYSIYTVYCIVHNMSFQMEGIRFCCFVFFFSFFFLFPYSGSGLAAGDRWAVFVHTHISRWNHRENSGTAQRLWGISCLCKGVLRFQKTKCQCFKSIENHLFIYLEVHNQGKWYWVLWDLMWHDI